MPLVVTCLRKLPRFGIDETGYGFTKIRQEVAKLGIRLSRQAAPPESLTIRRSDVVCTTRLGGLLKNYSRRAA